MMFQKYTTFLASGWKRNSNQTRESTGECVQPAQTTALATTADTSHTGCGPDLLQHAHNWLLVVWEGKPSSHPAWSHMSQIRHADKAGRPQCWKRSLRKHFQTSRRTSDNMWWYREQQQPAARSHSSCMFAQNDRIKLSMKPWEWCV